VVGQALGRQVASYCLERFLTPMRGAGSAGD